MQSLFAPFYKDQSVNLNKMNCLIEKYKLPKPTSGKIENVKRTIITDKKKVITEQNTLNELGPLGFTEKLYLILKNRQQQHYLNCSRVLKKKKSLHILFKKLASH